MSYAPQRRGRHQQPAQYNNSLDHSDSDRTDYTPYSQGSNYYGDDQSYYESGNQRYQSRGNNGSFNSGIVSAQQSLRGSFNSAYSDEQSGVSYGGESQASTYRSRQEGNQRSQNGNASVCGSTSATTVADGGRGRCPYQIGFNVQNAGKQMSTSKRIIHFRFGFANPQALASGQAGVDCRGQEHDLSITWSITGGKRTIAIDGREIQYTAGKRSNSARRADIVEAAWRMADHVFELKCYAYKPKAGSPEKRNPKWKQYNLTIDGRSFFELPEIFDLGLRGLGTGRLPVTISSGSDWDQTTDISSKQTVSSSIASTQYTDQSSVKSSIQSRIEEQRKLMVRKKQGATPVKKSRPKYPNPSVTSDSASDLSSSNLMSFRSLNVSDDQDDYTCFSSGFSSGVHSAEPSELREVRNRQSAAGEQANGTSTESNGTEHPQSAPTSERFSALVPQQQAQQSQQRYQPQQQAQQPQNRYQPQQHAQQPQQMYQPQEQAQPQQRYQPKTLPTMTESSTSVVSSRVQTQHPPQQSNIQVQEMSTQLTLAPQQPPTYEEITQALVPSPFVANDIQGHSQHQSSSMDHQPQALPPASQRLQILPEQQPANDSFHYQTQPTPTISNQTSAPPASNSSRYQAHPTNNNQRSAQHVDGSTQYQPHPTRNNQRSEQPAGNSSHYQSQPTNNNQRSAQPGGSSQYQAQPTKSNQRSAQPGGSSQYQAQPTNNCQRSVPSAGGSSQYQPRPTNNDQKSAKPAGGSSHYQSQPTNNGRGNARGQPIKKNHEPQQPIPGNL
eukprot:CAMPEP_0113372184 /NCGR_PEP_ID=MMETSP0013_2-20120614/405_1 /TAXON_ID=2843 ORGANISM="Skeletonema costatum, Strain 1716" /NCGR_SAMPLE_ID=MMETSP0013_2 /ASSEMBLY_ACC=CAM_ASM_000158 /LENGTH=781 /DNA_ID=CAMNT_0000254071 /DNA_START=204 /DNA_END=2545 /DNA_ORIENTATION=- /assembly_acc=CAM_ASM_000158